MGRARVRHLRWPLRLLCVPASWVGVLSAHGDPTRGWVAVRASEQELIGTRGMKAVCGGFLAIGWGPVPNQEHDLGTDLLVLARDRRRFDRGLVVGVQVKTGPHYFKRVERGDNGHVLGWWYYESDTDHFDDWVTHGLPHLLVLHCLEEGKSYWVHVTAKQVTSTGKGCKILVPVHQTIGDRQADNLFDVACMQKAAPVLEGTAFAGLPDGVPPGRRLRYALVAPRLVAPHPNASQDDPVDPVTAAALLAQGRFRYLKGLSDKHPSVPDPQQRFAGREWGWRFVAAVWHWATTDSVEQLEEALAEARTAPEEAASGVLLACALHRNERSDRALEVLDGLADGDRLLPADHGWVLVQRARFRTETGDLAGAQADAAEAQRCFAGDQDDVTVSALAAAAAWQMYSAAFMAGPDFENWDRDFEALISAADTAVSWWRAQTLAAGLASVETSRFEAWADPYVRYLFKWDGTTSPHLFSAEFTADIAGEHSQWKYAHALYGRYQITGAANSADEATELGEGLNALRRSGEYQSLKQAIRRLRYGGPLGSLAVMVNSIPVGGWTHTTADSNFAALARAGDLVEEPAATELACWSASVLENPSELNDTLKPSRTVPMAAMEAVAGLLHAAAQPAHSQVARIIAAIPDPSSHITPQCVAEAICALNYSKVDDHGRQALWEKVRAEQETAGLAALRWFIANNYPGAETEAISRTVSGDLRALEAVADLAALVPSEATAISELLAEAATQNLADARRGAHGGDRVDAAYWLVRMNAAHPHLDRWGEALDLLFDPATAGHDKIPACLHIAENPGSIPERVRDTLANNIASIGEAQRGIGFDDDISGIETVLAISLGSLSGGDAVAAMAELASGTAEQRRYAARLLGWRQQTAQQPMLAALITDHHPLVRHEAAIAVGLLAASDPSTLNSTLAWTLARKDGILLPAGLLDGLTRNSNPATPLAADIAHHHRQHPSAIIRGWANNILQ